MFNLKEIRKDFNKFVKFIERRSINIDLEKIKKLDQHNRDLIQKKENLEQEKKKFQNLKIKVYLKNRKRFQKN